MYFRLQNKKIISKATLFSFFARDSFLHKIQPNWHTVGPAVRTRLASECLAPELGPGSVSGIWVSCDTRSRSHSCAVPGLPASVRPCSRETGPAIKRVSQQTGTRGSSDSEARVTPGPWTRTRLRPLGRSRSQIPLLCDSPSSETHGTSLGQVSVTDWTLGHPGEAAW